MYVCMYVCMYVWGLHKHKTVNCFTLFKYERPIKQTNLGNPSACVQCCKQATVFPHVGTFADGISFTHVTELRGIFCVVLLPERCGSWISYVKIHFLESEKVSFFVWSLIALHLVHTK